MKDGKIVEIITSILPYLTVFFASLFHPYDNDLGWHLAYGKYFFQNHHILRSNIFSTEMPTYHWVNHSWLTDLVTYFAFHNFGFLGLSVLSALTITATFYFFSKAAQLNFYEKALIFPVLLYFLSPINSVSFRSQLLSLLLLGILTYVLATYQKSKTKLIYLLPLLFALWSNLHGEFILGLAIFAITIAARLVITVLNGPDPSKSHPELLRHSERSEESRSKLSKRSRFFVLRTQNDRLKYSIKENLRLIIVFFICALAVIINPFGLGVYFEAVKHFGNPLTAYIIEWVPFSILSVPWWAQVTIGFCIFFGVLFLIFSDKFKDKIPQIVQIVVLYLISFSFRRFVWPMYYLSLPLIAPVAAFFKPDSKKYATIAAGVILTLYLAITFLIDNPIKRVQNMSWQSYCQKFVQCSDGAIEYIIDHNISDNLMTYYGWGGYLIWNWPQIKPSIDGRMTVWRDETGSPRFARLDSESERAGEAGYSAFEDYYAYEQNVNDIDKSPYDVVLMSNQKPVYKRLQKLATENKWQKLYEDQFAGVFVRKD